MSSATDIQALSRDAIDLLQLLIAQPSFSKEESGTATIIQEALNQYGIAPLRFHNNIWAVNAQYDPAKPTLLLNSHHDTVRPDKHYTLDPFQPLVRDGKLYGLGSNDAGGALVALVAAFRYYYNDALPYNLLFAASAEEEISGIDGIAALLPQLGPVSCGIVGEPTEMQMAIAEKGLLVLDCTAHGQAGHAAREEGINAIYKALPDIQWFRDYRFEKISPSLGPVKMSVTMLSSGSQHNVVPASCSFTVDIRVNDCYTHEEVLDIVQAHVGCETRARSMRLRASSISMEHPLVTAGLEAGLSTFGSFTMSDKALMPFPTVKIGPGESARSHTADEFIYIEEIEKGVSGYIRLLQHLFDQPLPNN